jgi:hypothetical protein
VAVVLETATRCLGVLGVGAESMLLVNSKLAGGPEHVVTITDFDAAAHRVSEDGHVRGNLVLLVR